ncbi:MAG: hypothetical protein ACUVV6_03765 [Thermoplasmatota archaeon]
MARVFLYAQPLENEPYLSKLALRRGEYKEGGGMLGGIALTDVGEAVHSALDKIYQGVELAPLEIPVGSSPWAVRFTTSQFRLILRRRSCRPLEGAPGSYITLDFEGDKQAIHKFVKTFLKVLRRPPWEMVFRHDFRRRTGRSLKDVARDWEKFARRISLEPEAAEEGEEAEGEEGGKEAEAGAAARLRAERKQERARAPAESRPPPELELRARAVLTFKGERLVLSVTVENRSSVSVERVQVAPRSSVGTVFDSPPKVVSYLKPGESLTLSFPVAEAAVEGAAPGPAEAGEVWAEVGFGAERGGATVSTERRAVRAPLPSLSPVPIDPADWSARTRALVRRDEARARAAMPAPEAFDELLARVKPLGLFMLEPEVVRGGVNYRGRLRLFGEDERRRPFALALECVGDYMESKITLHYYAESAELALALRELVVGAIRTRNG